MRKRSRTRLASLTLIDIAAGAAISTIPLAAANAQGGPAANWTGYYIGAHVGYRWGIAEFTSPGQTIGLFDQHVGQLPVFNNKLNPDGGIGGAHFGYNWQFSPNWLAGLETDWTWGRSKASALNAHSGIGNDNDGFTFRRTADVTLLWQATIRARTGFVVDRSLWYVTGGVAFQHAKWNDSAVLQGNEVTESVGYQSPVTTKTLTGWVVGAGFEQMLAPNFTWRIEYLYESFSDWNVPQALGPAVGLDLEVHKVRVGFTFKP